MKKHLSNKRMLLPITAGLLVFMSALAGGTFAWFSGNATVAIKGNIYTAKIVLSATDMEIATYDFYPGVSTSVAWQQQFEATYKDKWSSADQWAFEDLLHQLYTSADPQWLYHLSGSDVVFGWNLNAAKGTYYEDFLSGIYEKEDIPQKLLLNQHSVH